MKYLLSLLVSTSLAATAVHAQSTMPAMGTNTPKGEVAKTDASLNQASTADRNSTSTKQKTSSGKRVHKTKTATTKSMGAM